MLKCNAHNYTNVKKKKKRKKERFSADIKQWGTVVQLMSLTQGWKFTGTIL